MKRKLGKVIVTIENYPEYLDKKARLHHWIEKKWAACILDFALRDGKRNLRVLDVGCGVGIITEQLISLAQRNGVNIEIAGVDESEQMISYIKKKFLGKGIKGVTFIRGDVTETSFPENSFDLIVATLFFSFLEDEKLIKFFNETYRLLSPGGQFCFYHTNRNQLAWTAAHLNPDKERYQIETIEHSYTPPELRKLINQSFLANSDFQAKSDWVGIMTKVFGRINKVPPDL